VSLIIEEYRGALRTRDNNGRFPIHLAAANSSGAKYIPLLAAKYPAGLTALD